MTRGHLVSFSGTLSGSASQPLITTSAGADGLRSFFMFQNQGAAAMYLAFSKGIGQTPTAVAGQPSLEVAAGATVIFDHFIPQGSVAVIGTSTQAFTCLTCGD